MAFAHAVLDITVDTYFGFINTINSESDFILKGGFQITKKKESKIENQAFTCSNPSCGKVFANPIKAKNLASKEVEPYNACPYCLTEIVIEEKASAEVENEPEPETKEIKINEPNIATIEEKSTQAPKANKCAHHFGYLSQRSSKEKIPEECMTCENIVQCMLKNVTS